MGKAYSEEQRLRVKGLLEAKHDEEDIEKETGVSDRTIRRWKMELERTGRIGKPPESRTGRHRVLNPDVEAALFEQVKGKPDMSVDDMLWWLYDKYELVVGTRTIRRVFERKGDKVKPKRMSIVPDDNDEEEGEDIQRPPSPPQTVNYQSPYAAMQPPQTTEQQLVQALSQPLPSMPIALPYPAPVEEEREASEDEEMIQLELRQIALQKRENELKLQMHRLRQGKVTPTPRNTVTAPLPPSSTLYDPSAAPVAPSGPKRDSRSKRKIEESRKRTAARQERMLRDLERRSRRRDHLTAEWVQSKDIWPLRAQATLADLMHRYGCYTFSPENEQPIDAMYHDLYHLVDLAKGDWNPQLHDELLRERMKRKMLQLRTKMQKTGEIVGRTDHFGGWQKADGYTGEAAGEADCDESEFPLESQMHPGSGPPPMHEEHQTAHELQLQLQHQHQHQPPHQHQQHQPQHQPQHDQIQYEHVPDQEALQQHAGMAYGAAALMQHSPPQPSPYPLISHPNIMPYPHIDAGQPGMAHQEDMV